MKKRSLKVIITIAVAIAVLIAFNFRIIAKAVDCRFALKPIEYHYMLNEVPDFRNVKWGMEPGEIAYLEESKFKSLYYYNENVSEQASTYMIYEADLDRVNNEDVQLKYYFNRNNELYRAKYIFEAGIEDDKIENYRNVLLKNINNIYNQPVSEVGARLRAAFGTFQDEYRESLGVEIYTWERNTKKLKLIYDNNKTDISRLVLEYLSKNIDMFLNEKQDNL